MTYAKAVILNKAMRESYEAGLAAGRKEAEMTDPRSDANSEALPLERLKTEAERWIPYIANKKGDSYGNASRGLRDVVQRAHDLGFARSTTPASASSEKAVALLREALICGGSLECRWFEETEKCLASLPSETPRGETAKVCHSPLATRPILYTDTLKGEQVCRDDLWAVTTEELNALRGKEER